MELVLERGLAFVAAVGCVACLALATGTGKRSSPGHVAPVNGMVMLIGILLTYAMFEVWISQLINLERQRAEPILHNPPSIHSQRSGRPRFYWRVLGADQFSPSDNEGPGWNWGSARTPSYPWTDKRSHEPVLKLPYQVEHFKNENSNAKVRAS